MQVVVLAAGQGTRMRSALPKVLQPLAGRPMLAHVLGTARTLGATKICVVYGHGGETVREALAAPDLAWALQSPQLGTGHAVQQALPHLDDAQIALVLYGDVPLIGEATLRRLLDAAQGNCLGLLTVELDDPTGYGRIVRNADGQVLRIVEHKDASEAERAVREVNTGILAAPAALLRDWLGRLGNDNAQGEYYLTDIIAMAVEAGVPVVATQPDTVVETLGVNNRRQLAELERSYQLTCAERLLDAGVTLADPARIDVRGELSCERDVRIDVNCVFEGSVTLGEDVHLGNFVEVKNSRIDNHSKANHLAYVGDADIGQRVNVGAGTITCNYDGANKFRTVIEDDVFIGSDTQLVAPVRVGRGATLGAGTTLSKDAPAEQLTVSRARQISIPGWKRPVKKPK